MCRIEVMGLQRRPEYEGLGNEEYLAAVDELRQKFDGNFYAAGLKGCEEGSVVYRIDERHSYEVFNPDLPAYIALLRKSASPGAKPVLHILLQELIKMPQEGFIGQAYAHVRLTSKNDIKIRHYSEVLDMRVGSNGYEDETIRGALFATTMDESPEVGRKLFVCCLNAIEKEPVDPEDDKVFNQTRFDKFCAAELAVQLVDAVSEEFPFHVEP